MGDLLGLGLGRRRGYLRATSATFWLERGLSLEDQDPTAAMHAYRRALAGCPSLADAHNNLGRLLHQAGDLVAAEQHYRAALAAAPSSLHWFNLGVVLEDREQQDPAIEAYERAIALDGELGEAHLNLARLLDSRGRGLDAAGDLQAAVRHLAVYRRLCARG
jgi:tetratricopeptide (TPR) repeat protein